MVPVAVLSLRAAREAAPLFGAVVSALEPEIAPPRLRAGSPHLVVRCHDVETTGWAGFIAPSLEDVRAVLDFANRHLDAELLIHCHKGVSRSPALALAVLADWYGLGAEEEAVAAFLHRHPRIAPNRLILKHADALLGRAGALWRAVTEEPLIAHRLKLKDALLRRVKR